MRAELERRFGDEVEIVYRDAEQPDVREAHGKLIDEIETKGLLYPVTVIDGVPLYDGAVSYPAIMRAVTNKLAERQGAEA